MKQRTREFPLDWVDDWLHRLTSSWFLMVSDGSGHPTICSFEIDVILRIYPQRSTGSCEWPPSQGTEPGDPQGPPGTLEALGNHVRSCETLHENIERPGRISGLKIRIFAGRFWRGS